MLEVNITRFGAKSGTELQTENIQSAIDFCFENGGGKVIVPSGDYLCAGVRLRSGVSIHLLEDAHLIGSRDCEAYMGFLQDKLEPIPDKDIKDVAWLPLGQRKNYDHMNAAASRWNNAVIKAIDAENISIIGEKGSYIDGQDCFDEKGEEFYRGPHAINFHRCKNVTLSGYEVRNSANWANSLFDCENVLVSGVKVVAGHDGIHITSCKNVVIKDCEFYTGDDSVAGIDNLHIKIENCIMNTACSALRFGGVDVTVKDCKMFGPAKYMHRGSLSDKEKREGASVNNSAHRYNMLSAYTYYADFSREIVNAPSDILIEDCEIENTDRLIHYNFSGNEMWQKNKPLKSITLKNITAKGIKRPLNVYGSEDVPAKVEISNSEIEFEDGEGEFMHLCCYEEVKMDDVKIKNINSSTLIKKWSNDGKIELNNIVCNPEVSKTETMAEDAFICTPI